MPKIVNWITIALSCALQLSVFGQLAEAIPDTPKILRIGNAGEPTTLDPHKYFTNLEEHVLKDLFVGLTTMAADGSVVPGCALTWVQSLDGLQWTFVLRENLKWSDGSPLTAQDFEYSFRRLLDPETAAPLAYFLYSIKNARAVNAGQLAPEQLGVRALNPYALQIELEHPFPNLPERLLYPIAYPVSKTSIDRFGDAWVSSQNWISNGPFVLNEWRSQEYVELAKNSHFYAADEVTIGVARYYPMSDESASYNRYLTDDLDVIGSYPRNLYLRLLQDRPGEVFNAPLQSIMYLVINTEVEPFDNLEIRRALALAIDREILTSRVMNAGELPSYSISPPNVADYQPIENPHVLNVEEAQLILENAGYSQDEPLRVELRYIANNDSKSAFLAVAAMWNRIGVTTVLHHAEIGDHFSELQRGNFQVAQAGWFGENNIEHYIELLWSKTGPANYGKYGSVAFDEVFELARATANLDERNQLLNDAEHIGLRDVAVIPLYVVNTRNLVKEDVGGWVPNGRNLHPLRYMFWK